MKRLELLRAIRDQRPYPKTWNPIARLVADGLVEARRGRRGAENVRITDWGVIVAKEPDSQPQSAITRANT